METKFWPKPPSPLQKKQKKLSKDHTQKTPTRYWFFKNSNIFQTPRTLEKNAKSQNNTTHNHKCKKKQTHKEKKQPNIEWVWKKTLKKK
jgi:hypothetical protein